MAPERDPTFGAVANEHKLFKVISLVRGCNVKIWFSRFEMAAAKFGLELEDWMREVFLASEEDIFRALVSLGCKDQSPYQEVKRIICERYGDIRNTFDIQTELDTRKQRDGETLDEFHEWLKANGNFAYTDWDMNKVDSILMNIFIVGIYSKLVRSSLKILQPGSLAEVLIEAKRLSLIESCDSESDFCPIQVNKRTQIETPNPSICFLKTDLNSLKDSLRKLEETIHCNQISRSYQKNIRCYKCGRLGYVARFCRNYVVLSSFYNSNVFLQNGKMFGNPIKF